MKTLFHKLSIHYRLLLSYSMTFLFISVIGSLVIYSQIRSTLAQNIENELKNSTQAILGMVQTAIDASIRNHLHAIAEKNREVAAYFYHQHKIGKISEKEAKTKTIEVFLSQSIGKSGYLYCISSNGIILVHPEKQLIGTDISGNDFVRLQKEKKEGYLEYDWANPKEIVKRPKALYMSYFGPWDWIISASSYRDEFKELLSVHDFQDNILSITFGKTGYPYVMDSKGLLIIHPKLQGTNIYNFQDDNQRKFIKEVCEKKNGKIIYPWKNPGEKYPREKLVIFNYIPELDWIVSSSSYLEEFYHPLTTMGYSIVITVFIMLILIIPITWLISSRLAKPLQEMIRVFENGAQADFSNRLDHTWGGEMGEVAKNYNIFIDTLEKTRHQLEKSEETFRNIFENSVEGIFQISIQGNIITANPAMAAMFGFRSADRLMAEISDFWQQLCYNPEQFKEIIIRLEEKNVLHEYQFQLNKKDQTSFWCSFNAKAYRNESGSIAYIEGFLSDITQRRIAQEALERSHRELEKRVEERTKELSNWVKDLEQTNFENALLRKMSEMIQVCHTSEEIYDVAQEYCIQFFPKTSGRVYVMDDSHSVLQSMVSWGDLNHDTISFQKQDCWALRRSKPYFMQKAKRGLACNHLTGSSVEESLCAPMIVQEDILGMLHIESRFKDFLESKQSLALIITEHLSLALINMRLRESLRLQSIQDPLTGLYNRRFLDESLRREAYSMKRHNFSIGILMMDIDHFKKVNDTHGHDFGDATLRALGAFLKKNTRQSDIACRYGGEEFVIILIKTTLKETIQTAEKLLTNIRENLVIVHNKIRLSITVSIGVSLCPIHGIKIEDAMKAADKALYQAKNMGRNQVTWPEH